MIRYLCSLISTNKNLLMLFTVFIYVLALFSVFSNLLIWISLLLTLFGALSIYKNLFSIKHVIIWCLIFYIGVLNTSLRLKDTDILLNLAPVNCEITGTVVSIPQGKSEGKAKFFFNVKSISYNDISQTLDNEKVLVTVNELDTNFKDLKIYNSYKLSGRLSPPFKAGNPSQFDYGNYLRNYNTYAVFYAKDFLNLNEDLSNKYKFLQKINDYREAVISVHSQFLQSPNLEILGGIVFGDDAVSPPKEIKQSFVNSGLLHILAASGMNVVFIYTFFYWLMRLLKIDYRISVILGMFTVVVYCLMTGLGASVVRATIMLLFVSLGKLIDRDAHSVSLLSFVGLLMLLYNPMFINDIGFQLSFIVTFGILVTSPLVIRFNHKIKDFLVGTVAIPIIAQLWVIPIQIFYFNNISLYSIFANIMSVPVLMIVSSGGFISSLLAVVKPFADKICKIFDFILNPMLTMLVNISDFWGHLPRSAIETTHPNIFQVVLYYLILLTVIALFYKNIKEKFHKQLLVFLIVLSLIWGLTLIPIRNSNLEIITFDVGNADCFLLKTPKNEYIMVDTGRGGYNGGKSQAEIVLLKYFKDRGIKNLKAIIVTHFDNDHCGGVLDLLKSLKVDKIYVNNLQHESITAKMILETAKRSNVNVVLAENQQEVYAKDKLTLTNYIGANTDSDNDNENSILTVLKYGSFNMLFTGDVGIKGLKTVLKELPSNIIVLKVPHHGASGSIDAEIISYLSPKFSIISVGENKFGHPSPLTLENLKRSVVFRTDINNSIKFVVNNKGFKIYTYDTEKRKYKLVSIK